MAESSTQRKIRKALEAEGAYVLKQHGGAFGSKGAVDLVVCYRGMFYGLEVKEPGEQPEPMQRVHLGRIVAAGGVSAVVRSVEEALAALERPS